MFMQARGSADNAGQSVRVLGEKSSGYSGRFHRVQFGPAQMGRSLPKSRYRRASVYFRYQSAHAGQHHFGS